MLTLSVPSLLLRALSSKMRFEEIDNLNYRGFIHGNQTVIAHDHSERGYSNGSKALQYSALEKLE